MKWFISVTQGEIKIAQHQVHLYSTEHKGFEQKIFLFILLFFILFSSYILRLETKAATYDGRPKMKRDARVKVVVFSREKD